MKIPIYIIQALCVLYEFFYLHSILRLLISIVGYHWLCLNPVSCHS